MIGNADWIMNKPLFLFFVSLDYTIISQFKAARLYIDVMGYLNGQGNFNTTIQTQTNNIQINGIVISQEIIHKLDTDQLKKLEKVLQSVIPNK